MDDEQKDSRRRKLLATALHGDAFTPPSSVVRAEFGARSHRGRVPDENDDHYLTLRLVQHADTLLTSLPSVDLPSSFAEHAYAAVDIFSCGTKLDHAVRRRRRERALSDKLQRKERRSPVHDERRNHQ